MASVRTDGNGVALGHALTGGTLTAPAMNFTEVIGIGLNDRR